VASTVIVLNDVILLKTAVFPVMVDVVIVEAFKLLAIIDEIVRLFSNAILPVIDDTLSVDVYRLVNDDTEDPPPPSLYGTNNG
jgi:hypothetical protein